ncbi:MAG TPA: choice-of-anchor L domain-containing protein, partial [Burkholderiales bacterium]|nr:choice-of-anchor L domain-containing protein [Burkholderiales bacterium]
PLTNTSNSFNTTPGSGSNALLSTLSGQNTNDANALSFSFTSTNPTANSVSIQFVFGTDEFPTQSVTDIFGFFVDGVNYAKFPSGELISNTPGNPTNFILNPVGGGLYDIEYNGLTQVFTAVGLFDPTLETHTLTIAIADTSDSIFQSGVYIGALNAKFTEGPGGIDPDPENGVPEPSTLALLGLALGIAGLRKKK